MSNEKQKLLDITFDRLSEKYPSGLYEWLYTNKIEVYRKIFKLEDKINENFNSKGSVQDLKMILREYWIESMKAIINFKECGHINVSLDEARSERIDSLETGHVL